MAVVAGIAAMFAGARPTGQTLVDLALVGIAVGLATWVAATAPWWILVIGAGVVATTAIVPSAVALAVVGLLLAGWVGSRRQDLSGVRAASAALTINAAARSDLDVGFGVSAVVAISVVVAFVIAGALRQQRHLRRITIGLAAGGLVAAISATLVVGAAALGSRNELEESVILMRRAVTELGAGEVDEGRSTIDRARDELERVQNAVASPWTAPARLVPVVAQHRQATIAITAAALDAVDVLEIELGEVDLGALRPVGGRIDVGEIERIDLALARIDDALAALDRTLDTSRSPWLLDALQRRISGLTDELDAERLRSAPVREAVGLLPGFLGSDGERRYLIAFTTPAEARGHGGFMGNFAEITAVDGQLTMSRFGRTGELNSGGVMRRLDASTDLLDDWLVNYGRFGFDSSEGGTVGSVPWSNITIGSNFPETAAVMSALYPQSGGLPVDGVFAVDIDTVASMMDFTGPVDVDGLDQPLTAATASEFLLYDQYRVFEGADRVDFLETVSEIVIGRLLDGAVPSPAELVDTLEPMVREGRLAAWSPRDDEQALFDRLGMTHRLPAAERDEAGSLTVDAVAASFTNATGSKLELFLDAEVDYTLDVDDTGRGRGVLSIDLTNTAPLTGWPDGVIGNRIDLPVGTNRVLVSLLTSLPPQGARLDGQAVGIEIGREAGLYLARRYVTLAPGERRTLAVEVAGGYPTDPVGPAEIRVRTPAAVRPVPATVTVTTPSGTVTQRVDTPGTHRIDLR